MMTAEENDLLCRVEDDAPMGQIMRRHWIAACLSEEVAQPAVHAVVGKAEVARVTGRLVEIAHGTCSTPRAFRRSASRCRARLRRM